MRVERCVAVAQVTAQDTGRVVLVVGGDVDCLQTSSRCGLTTLVCSGLPRSNFLSGWVKPPLPATGVMLYLRVCS